MATVRLTREQCERDRLPAVCARCGEPGWERVERQFRWYPPWAGALIPFGILPGVLLIYYLTRKVTVRFPMCDRHVRHWDDHARFARWAGLGWLLLFVGGALLAGFGGPEYSRAPMLGLAALFPFAIANGIWQARLIQPVRVTADAIELKNVHQAFADAAAALRDGDDPNDDPPQPRRNRYDVDVAEE